MKAFVCHQYGSPDVMRLEEIDRPEPNEDQVLVRVLASSVNAHDWHMLRGKPYIARLSEGVRRRRTSRVLGLDVAGIAEAVSPNVTDVKVGDRVFGSRWGSFAEYVCAKTIVPMPANLTFEQAAAVPTAGFTALQGLRDKGQAKPGDRVLINGAGGGVGTFAVQIAKALGTEVTAVTSAGNVDLMRQIGADQVIDYARDDFTRKRGGYDLILDIGGNRRLSHMRRALGPAGRIVMVAPQPGQWIGPVARMAGAVVTSRFASRKAIGYLASVNRPDLLVLREMIEAGRVTPVIDRTFPFDQIPDAIRYVEQGRARGKVVITSDPSIALSQFAPNSAPSFDTSSNTEENRG